MFTLTLVAALTVLCAAAAPFALSMRAADDVSDAFALACKDLGREMEGLPCAA